jgi:hypothetical protein
MQLSVDQRRRAMRGLGIALVGAGVVTHIYEQRMLRVRLATSSWERRAGQALEDPGGITSTIGIAVLAASRRLTRDG